MIRTLRKKMQAGFTLVELMIVVAIIGILAVLAVYGVNKYIANAKTAEARQSLGRLSKDATSAYEAERISATILSEGAATAVTRALCDSTGIASVPSVVTGVRGKKYNSKAGEWQIGQATASTAAIGWACLRFEIASPQYYMYSYKAVADTSMTATAEGDLDNNATDSTFRQVGAIDSTTKRLRLAPQLQEIKPEE